MRTLRDLKRSRDESSGSSYVRRRDATLARWVERGSGIPRHQLVDWRWDTVYVYPYVQDAPGIANSLSCTSDAEGIQCINLISQGTGPATRIGDRIRLQRIRVRGFFWPGGSVNAFPSYVKCALVYEGPTNGGYPLASFIFAEQFNNVGPASNGICTSFQNPNLMEDYVVLKDELRILPPVEDTEATLVTVPATMNSELKVDWDVDVSAMDLDTVYTGTKNPMSIAFVQTGALYLIMYGNQTNANMPWCFAGDTRVYYTDV